MQNLKLYFLLLYFLSTISIGCEKISEVKILKNPPKKKHSKALSYWYTYWKKPRPVCFHIARIPLKNLTYEICTLLADDPDGKGPAEAKLESPIKLTKRYKALIAINANAFQNLPGTGKLERLLGWYNGKHVDIIGLAASDGIIRSQPEPRLGSFWIDTKRNIHIGHVKSTKHISHGVANWIDRLLVNGKIIAKKKKILHPRTLVGVDKQQHFLFFVVVDGRQFGYSEGVSLHEAAIFMKNLGCYNASNFDGGGSSIMIIQEPGKKAKIMNRPSNGMRPIPVMLGVRKR